MTAALIVIEVAASEVSEEALSVLVSACTRAARGAECVLTKDASEEQPSAVAIVSLQPEDKMRVEVGIPQVGHDSWRTKDFSFVPADQPLDRWRAVGFAIGTLAESNPAPSKDVAPPPAPSVPPPRSRAPLPPPAPIVRPERPPGAQLFVGSAAIVGPGLSGAVNSPWRVGGSLDAELAFPKLPVFFVAEASAATRFSGAASGTSARWLDLSLGGGIPLVGPIQGSGLELRAQLMTELFDVEANAPGRSETRTRWTMGVQGVLGARLELVPGLLLTADLRGAVFSGSSVVRVATQDLGENASFRYLGSLGLRVRLR